MSTVARGARPEGIGASGFPLKYLYLLAVLVAFRLVFHAVFVPAYEGPDEPFHLARISDFADRPFSEAIRGLPVSGAVLGAVAQRPCGLSLHNLLGCEPFGSRSATFNVISARTAIDSTAALPNPENNQPPVFYLTCGLILRVARNFHAILTPDARLLAVRLLNGLLVAGALAWSLRIFRSHCASLAATAYLLLFFLPGASESLVRCSNDAFVFAWATVAVVALRRHVSIGWMILICAIGPLIKLTALPVAAFVVVELWRTRKNGSWILAGIASLMVFPIQAARGWKYGGTYELNRPTSPIGESTMTAGLGFMRSVYTFLKTAPWLGEWSFFRAPKSLLLLFFVLVIFAAASARIHRSPRSVAHLVAATLAFAGFTLFAIANRRYFGVWGGVGGWYLWTWAPWLREAVADHLEFHPATATRLLVFEGVTVLVFNVVYFHHALDLYR